MYNIQMFIIFVVSIIKSLITMLTKEEQEIVNQLEQELLYYLRNYNELTKARQTTYKKIVDKEINEIIKQLKALSR